MQVDVDYSNPTHSECFSNKMKSRTIKYKLYINLYLKSQYVPSGFGGEKKKYILRLHF